MSKELLKWFVLRDKKTHAFFIESLKDGMTVWTLSPFLAKQFKKIEDAQKIAQDLEQSGNSVSIEEIGSIIRR